MANGRPQGVSRRTAASWTCLAKKSATALGDKETPSELP